MIVPAYPGRVAPLEFFMARKLGMGFFRVKFWSKYYVGFCLKPYGFFFFWGGGGGLFFSPPPPPRPLGKNLEEKQNPFEIVPPEQVGTLPVDFTTSNEELSN